MTDHHIHLHLHPESDESLLERLDCLTTRIEALSSQGVHLMATMQDLQNAISQIDTATTEIANDLQALRDRLAGGGLSAMETQQVLDQLAAHAERLRVMGQDPENPVPNPAEPAPPTT